MYRFENSHRQIGDDKHRFLALQSECAKRGFDISLNISDYGDKSGLLRARADLRRMINDIKADAEKAIKAGDNKRADELIDTVRDLGLVIDGIGNQLDMDAAAEAAISGRGQASSTGWCNADGQVVHVLDRADKASALPSNSRDENAIGFGDAIKAMALGTRDPDLRAALSEGSDANGGYTVPDRLLRELIDVMRARQVTVRAGARTVLLDTEKTSIARVESDPVAAWRLENAAIAESDPTFGRVQFQARSLAVLVKVSRELLEDSINIHQALMAAFAGSMAVELDRVALFGSGVAPEPTGLFGTAGIGTLDLGANGAAFASFAPFIVANQTLQEANVADPTGAIMSPRSFAALGGLVDTTGQPLRKPDMVQAIPFLSSSQVPNNLEHGTAENASTVLVGDFTQLMIGVRTSLRIEMLRELFAGNHQYGFVAHLRADVAVAQPSAFVAIKGVIPPAS